MYLVILFQAEGEYYTCCTRAERSRIEWEATTQRGGRCLYALEQERLTQLKDLLAKYYACLRDHGPRICQTVERILSEVSHPFLNSNFQ